jgi:D-alanyl-D-alanine carboxypeptidase
LLIRKLISCISISALLITPISSAQALSIPRTFEKLAASPTLAKPGIIVLDPSTETEIYSDAADIPRAPASVLKLISATAAITAYGSEKVFQTSISATDDPSTFILQGELDPWLTTSPTSAKKFHRALSTKLISAITKNGRDLSGITIKYNGVFEADIKSLKAFYGQKIKFVKIAKPAVVEGQEVIDLAKITSPTLREILEFTLLWSDNTLADRLARNAALKMGYSRDDSGLNLAFKETLNSLDVESKGLKVFDGSGLSHGNRVSVQTIAELLLKIRTEPQLQAIYDGLPVAGKTGTLKKRFKKYGTAAKGLVKAKTGWINTSVTLAGYVEAKDSEYVFVVIANHIKPTERSRDEARKVIDKMLATIAKPLEIA